MDKVEVSNLEWLKKVAGINAEDWHSEVVLKSNQIPYYKFYNRSKYKRKRKKIDPSKIIGIDYDLAYNDNRVINWKELLNGLKRFERIRSEKQTKEELIKHALSDYNETRTVEQYGDQFITICGQHRMALCKFLKIEEVEVDVEEYEFDDNMFNLYRKRKKFVGLLYQVGLINKKEFEKQVESHNEYYWYQGKIGKHFFFIHNEMIEEFWHYYEQLNIKPLSRFISKITGVFYYLDEYIYENRRIDYTIDTPKSISAVKYYLMDLKYEMMSKNNK